MIDPLEHSPVPDSGYESFILDDDCEGIVWHDAAGWSGCLKWDIEGNTNFVGPFTDRIQATSAVRAEYRVSIEPASLADPD